MTQSTVRRLPAKAPALVRMPGPVIGRLLRSGLSLGPNMLITVRGRTSGQPRTQPLAVVEAEGRQFVVGAFGDVNWCRNMRANPDVRIHRKARDERVRASELSVDEAIGFFRERLPRAIPRMPLLGKVAVWTLIHFAAPDIKSDPERAARRLPVFELSAV